ncbi:BTAD domain-containing putative transcriptional regulator [Actinomadura sp. 6N118]|uniref:BTAD domain-containing putative transcriptional regulator n=1 Tax=Actinomadura sp. 6N118 TaxID=3375151 RepID=UPI0037B3A0DF
MRFGVLGPLEVWAADGSAVRVPEAKVRALLADLLVNEGRVVSADRLADDLWGEDLPGNPSGALQTKVWHLRRALEDAEPGARKLVVSRAPGYLLLVEADAIDAGRFGALLAQATAADDPRERAALLTDALALWRGPAYADFADEEFARPAITRLEEQRLVALEERAAARLELGEHGLLVGELADLVEQHPLRERLRAVQLRALYRAGRQSEALATYNDLRARLREELGLDPGPELAELQRAILTQDPALDPKHPAEAPPRTNLPASVTELIGRTDAIAAVRDLLKTSRLVTLTGPGGVGKTRLGIETAARSDFPDGVWLVELATLDRTAGLDRLADLVTTTLGLRDDTAPEEDPLGLIATTLRTRRTLLVLDNCEHVIEPAAALAQHLLKTAPDLHILATGQEPLGLSGESIWPVPPLALPATTDPPTPTAPPAAPALPAATDPRTATGLPVAIDRVSATDHPDLGVLRESSAVRLFLARAAAASPGFQLTQENAAAVVEICRRLDGIPLALELAATRLRVLGVRALRDRLNDRFRVLASGHRGAPPRQQTLRAVIDWSWELLTGAERTVLRRLAVHADGCTLEAAEEVCAGGGVDAADVLDLLARLVDRSLVVVTERADGTRYRLLESVAVYCHERLEDAGEATAVRERHGVHYAAFAERAARHIRGHQQRQWLEHLDAEAANLRAALEGAARRGDAHLALRLVNALAWYWFLRGRLSEASRSLGLALAVEGDEAPCSVRAEAMVWRIVLAIRAGNVPRPMDRVDAVLDLFEQHDDPAGARAHAEWLLGFALFGYGDISISEDLVSRALMGFRAVGDRWGTAAALSTQANQAVLRGDFPAAERCGAESAALFHELGDRWGQLATTDVLGAVAEVTGDYERAARLHREGLRTAEELKLWPDVSRRLSGLGRIALLSGDHVLAGELLERGRRLAADHADEAAEEHAEIGLALLARRQGRLDAAEAHLRRWLDWCRERGGDHGVALILAELGFIAEQRGDAEAAMSLQAEGYETARTTGDPRAVALALEGLAGAHALSGDHLRAAGLLGAAHALRGSVGTPLPPAERGDVERITAAVRDALGESAFTAAFTEAELPHVTASRWPV